MTVILLKWFVNSSLAPYELPSHSLTHAHVILSLRQTCAFPHPWISILTLNLSRGLSSAVSNDTAPSHPTPSPSTQFLLRPVAECPFPSSNIVTCIRRLSLAPTPAGWDQSECDIPQVGRASPSRRSDFHESPPCKPASWKNSTAASPPASATQLNSERESSSRGGRTWDPPKSDPEIRELLIS